MKLRKFGEWHTEQWKMLARSSGACTPSDRFELGHIQTASDLFSGGLAAATDVSGIVLVAPGYQELASEALEVPLASRNIRTQFLPLPWAVAEVEAIGTLLHAAGHMEGR